jgi:hypothetical protein
MRLRNLLACGLTLPLLAFSAVAQSTPTQQSAPAQQSTPAQPSGTPQLELRDLPPDPHTLTPEEQAEQKARQMRMELTRIATAQASWGPPISAKGMSLDMKETARTKTPTGTQITYQLTGKGFTPDMQLTLIRWALNQPVTKIMSGIAINADGTAVCAAAATRPATPASATSSPASATSAASPTTTAPPPDPNPAPSCAKTITPGTPITITTTAAKGEAIRLGLVTPDRKHGAAVSLVPFPIEGQDKGCKLSVILGSKDAELVLVKGEGFQKDATYTLGTESYGEKHPLSATINPQGHFVAAITPWVHPHDSGDTVVYYQSSTCSPTVSLHWGKDTYKPE